MLGLKNSADIRTLCLLGAKCAWVVTHWVLFPFLGNWNWVLAPLGFFPAFFTCCITHNAMHCDTFQNKHIETGFRAALSVGLGHPVQLYIPTHNHNHHVHTQTSNDHIATQKVNYSLHFMNLLLYFFHILPAIGRLEGQYVFEQIQKRGPVMYRIAVQAGALYGTWAVLIWMDWRRFLCCVYLPGYLGIYGILTMNMLQHDGCSVSNIRKGKEMDTNNSRNFVNPILNFFTLNNGYHSIHHMFPTMHWSLYKAKHEEFVKPHIDPTLDQPYLIGYIFKAYFWPGVMPDHRKGGLASKLC
jgi:fatty acid desaturase